MQELATIVIWVMLSLGSNYRGGSPTMVIERFASRDDCYAALKLVRQKGWEAQKNFATDVDCVEMRVLRP